MKTARVLILTAFTSAAALASVHDAAACGGCFQQQDSQTTQVTGHRMILSISPTSTTLWDQIEYSGAPESFAWVLPINGQVDVGISSDALFQVLQQLTEVTVVSPSYSCGSNATGSYSGTFGSGGGGGAGGSDGGVTIIDQEVVGPYETVQLTAQDPNALTNWLTQHGYNIPANIQPIVDDYVNDGFGFLALKLVPGQGVNSMKPVRVTTPGASPVLPLRMVAAGTGAFTALQLWVFGEGRWEPANFPSFVIDESDVVWNWDTSSSNYSELVEAQYAASNNTAWLVDSARQRYTEDFWVPLQYDALEQYADENGMNAEANLDADMAALYGGFDQGNMWVTHMVSKLSQAALATDLQVQASASQTYVDQYLTVYNTVGTHPCGDGTGGDGTGGDGTGNGGNGGSGGDGNTPGGKGSCQCGVAGGGPAELGTLAFAFAAALAAGRRRRRVRTS